MPKTDEDMENLDHSNIAGGNIKWYGNSGKVWQVLKKTKCSTPQYLAIVLLGIHPREIKSYVYSRQTCT